MTRLLKKLPNFGKINSWTASVLPATKFPDPLPVELSEVSLKKFARCKRKKKINRERHLLSRVNFTNILRETFIIAVQCPRMHNKKVVSTIRVGYNLVGEIEWCLYT